MHFWNIMLFRTISFLAISLKYGEASLYKLNNSRIQIRIRIFTEIETIHHCHTLNLPTKFHPNPSTTFKDILYTNNHTNRQGWKHNLLPPVVVDGPANKAGRTRPLQANTAGGRSDRQRPWRKTTASRRSWPASRRAVQVGGGSAGLPSNHLGQKFVISSRCRW